MAADLIPATRAEALLALHDFIEGPVLHYARLRNHIADRHTHVSRLSAAIAHRLVTEAEVLSAVLRVHKPTTVEKFIQEVVWRSYWKGWLELHSGVWCDFADDASAGGPLAERLCEGQSGCAAMDACARELVSTGYLHNHTRMWWASFWIRRAGLPWKAGARFFFDHLLDADAASNTLSWRWVAGLQTPGKTYLVRRSNLDSYWPDAPPEGLHQLEGEPCVNIPQDSADRSLRGMEDLPEAPGDSAAGLLLHEEDFSLECGPLSRFHSVAACFWKTPPRSRIRAAWLNRAVDDARARAENHFQKNIPEIQALDALKDWVENHDLRHIVMAAPSVGPVRDSLNPFLHWCSESGIVVTRLRRRWDERVFPWAKAGFFPFWNSVRPQLPELIL
ncbi:MAG: FAD-binding domain-containing protein [Spartobacteria bacterium]